MGKSITIIFALLLIFIGIFINFIPTITYFITIYPKIPLDSVSPGAYFTYSVLLTLPLHSKNGSYLFYSKELLLNISVLDNGSYKVSLCGEAILSGLNFTKPCTIQGTYVLNSSNPFIRMLIADTENASVGNYSVPLEIKPNEYTGSTFNGLDPYEAMANVSGTLWANANEALWYIELNNGEFVLFDLFYIGTPSVNSGIMSEAFHIFLNNVLEQNSIIKDLTSTMKVQYKGLLLIIHGLSTNVKTANNIAGEVEWNFTTSFFPINVVLIAIGVIILVLKSRGKLT